MILQLRRVPEINVRIFVYTLSLPKSVEEDAVKVEAHLKEFLTQISRGMTMTSLPRPSRDSIRIVITLISMKDQLAFWKYRLKSIEHKVRWETATQDEIQVWGDG